MAPAQSKTSNNGMETPRTDVLLPLVPLPPTELDTTTSVIYPLYSNPADTTSTTYKVTVRRLNGSEDVRTMIQWSKDVNKVVNGLAITADNQYTQAVTVCESMMDGRVSAIFAYRCKRYKELRMARRAQEAYDSDGGNEAAKQAAKDAIIAQGWEHADNNQLGHIRLALNDTLASLMPKKILARCKRHLRRHCRKPRDMKIREYCHLVSMMNSQEFTHLPPWGRNQELPDDEILDIIIFGIPKSWEKEMERQGFDPMAQTLPDVIAKLEDIESAEGFDAEATKVTNTKTTKKKSPAKPSNESNQGNNKKHCLYHGWGGHTTDECDKLKQQVKKLKADNNNNNSSNGKKDANTKKSGGDWKKKAEQAKKEGDGFAMTMNKIVQKAVKSAIKSNKRRSRDDSSEGSLAAFDKMEVEGFDYDQMENLVISEDGEILV